MPNVQKPMTTVPAKMPTPPSDRHLGQPRPTAILSRRAATASDVVSPSKSIALSMSPGTMTESGEGLDRGVRPGDFQRLALAANEQARPSTSIHR